VPVHVTGCKGWYKVLREDGQVVSKTLSEGGLEPCPLSKMVNLHFKTGDFKYDVERDLAAFRLGSFLHGTVRSDDVCLYKTFIDTNDKTFSLPPSLQDQNCVPFVVPINLDKSAPVYKAHYTETVMMFGYPYGFTDDETFLPLVRTGVSASHLSVDFRQKGRGLVNIANYEVDSGSPLMWVRTQPSQSDINFSRLFPSNGFRPFARLVGMLRGGHYNDTVQVQYQQHKIDAPDQMNETRFPLSLGEYIKTDVIKSWLSELQ